MWMSTLLEKVFSPGDDADDGDDKPSDNGFHRWIYENCVSAGCQCRDHLKDNLLKFVWNIYIYLRGLKDVIYMAAA